MKNKLRFCWYWLAVKPRVKIFEIFLKLRWKLLGPYFDGICQQAYFFYRWSPLFKLRWQEMGYDFAEQCWEESVHDRLFFFAKARNSPWRIRWQIFVDALCGREPRPYYCKEE